MIIVKTFLGNDVRRFLLPEEASYEELKSLVNSLYGNNCSDNFIFKYHDEERDLCSITSDVELNEAIRICSQNTSKILRLTLFANNTTPRSSLTSSVLLQGKVVSSTPLSSSITLSSSTPLSSSLSEQSVTSSTTTTTATETNSSIVIQGIKLSPDPNIVVHDTVDMKKAIPSKQIDREVPEAKQTRYKSPFAQMLEDISKSTARSSSDSLALISSSTSLQYKTESDSLAAYARSVSNFYKEIAVEQERSESIGKEAHDAFTNVLKSLCVDTAKTCDQLKQEMETITIKQVSAIQEVCQQVENLNKSTLLTLFEGAIRQTQHVATEVLENTKGHSIAMVKIANELHESITASIPETVKETMRQQEAELVYRNLKK